MPEREQELQYLTTVEAADFLRMKPGTLQAMRVDGSGPRYRKLGPKRGALVVYLRADLVEWVDRYAFNSTSEYPTRG